MIIYNVTTKVELSIHELWLRWMKEDHIPKVLATGCFHSYKVYRIVEENQADGMSYAVQYFTDEITQYFIYQEKFAEALRKEVKDLFPDKTASFRTLLREV
jgi:hypothetical protein